MTERGVIGIAREIWDDPDFKPEPFTEREAFMWLVSEAAWREHTARGPKGPVKLKRGEVSHSIRFMAKAWQWQKSRVARFLNKLKNRDTIRHDQRDGNQIYYIKNYNKFQVVGLPERDSERDTDRDSSGTAAGQQRDKLETGKHLNINGRDSYESLVGAERADPPERYPVQQAYELYNLVAQDCGLPRAKGEKPTPERARKIRARLKDHGFDGWKQALTNLSQSEFLLGKNDKGWRADLDFVLQPKSFNRLIEGFYQNETEGV